MKGKTVVWLEYGTVGMRIRLGEFTYSHCCMWFILLVRLKYSSIHPGEAYDPYLSKDENCYSVID